MIERFFGAGRGDIVRWPCRLFSVDKISFGVLEDAVAHFALTMQCRLWKPWRRYTPLESSHGYRIAVGNFFEATNSSGRATTPGSPLNTSQAAVVALRFSSSMYFMSGRMTRSTVFSSMLAFESQSSLPFQPGQDIRTVGGSAGMAVAKRELCLSDNQTNIDRNREE